MEHNTRRLGTVVTSLNILIFFAALMFMHLASWYLNCPSNGCSLSDLVTKILIQVVNLLWMDGICILPHRCCSIEEQNRIE